jgi:putative redox protein
MPTSQVVYLGDLRTQATHIASGQTFITDAPVDNHGRGEAFSPTDLTATSLATCAMTIMGLSARNHGIDITGASADVTKTMSSDPRRISGIEIIFQMPTNGYSEKERKILETAGRTCPVLFSLDESVVKTLIFHW